MANKGNRSGPAVVFGAVRSSSGSLGFGGGSIGAMQGLVFGGMTTILGDGTFGRHVQIGVLRNNTEGSPAQPSLELNIPGMWRFRWGVTPGVRTIQINVKQAINTSPRPTMTVKANAAIGVATDQVATAASASGWIVLGPISITVSAAGPLWVELRNNYYGNFATPCYFDHIVAT